MDERISRIREYQELNFKPEAIPVETMLAGKKITDNYSLVPSIEIWSDEVANITVRQTEFSLESVFIEESQARMLFSKFLELLELLKKFATQGSKNGAREQNYRLYKNEILIADTTWLFKMGEKRVTFITYNTMSILTTAEEKFCRQMEGYLNNVINKSVLISVSGEWERNKFFNRISEPLRRKPGLYI